MHRHSSPTRGTRGLLAATGTMMSSFDERARTWDDDSKIERARLVGEAIREAVPIDSSTRLLEYGAGTGLVSQELADRVGSVTLADSSTGMREMMEEKVAVGSLPTGARIWDLDLTIHAPPRKRFDLIVTVMTLHHVPELAPVLDGFAAMLAEDGHLCVVDLEEEGGDFHHGHDDFHGHDGFAHEDLASRLRAAGFDDVRFEPCDEVEKDGRPFPLFLAVVRPASRGRRPS